MKEHSRRRRGGRGFGVCEVAGENETKGNPGARYASIKYAAASSSEMKELQRAAASLKEISFHSDTESAIMARNFINSPTYSPLRRRGKKSAAITSRRVARGVAGAHLF